MHPTAQLVSNPAGSARTERTNEQVLRRDDQIPSIEGAFAMLLGGMGPQATLSRDVMDTLKPLQTEEDKKKMQAQRAAEQQANRRSDERRQVGQGESPQPQDTAIAQSSMSGVQAGTKSSRESRDSLKSTPSERSTHSERVGDNSLHADAALPKSSVRSQHDTLPGQHRSAEQTGSNSFLEVHSASSQSTTGAHASAQASALAPLLAAGQARAASGATVPLTPGNSQGITATPGMTMSAGRGTEKALAKPHAKQSPQPEPGADPALRAQLARGLGMALRSGQGTATIRLDPQHLGTLRVDVSVRDHLVEAIFRPSSVEAQRLLEADRGALENALQARGLRVDRVEVRAPLEIANQLHGESVPDSPMDGRAGSQEADGRHAQGEHGRSAGGTAQHDPGREASDRSMSVAETADETSPRAETGGACHLIDTIA